ncbi:uncharacterized protein METZ01_LOCUS313662, partial [marine metagenome]
KLPWTGYRRVRRAGSLSNLEKSVSSILCCVDERFSPFDWNEQAGNNCASKSDRYIQYKYRTATRLLFCFYARSSNHMR